MIIIEQSSLTNGAHRNQNCPDNTPIPDGFVRVADGVDISTIPSLSFVQLTITDGVITALSDDAEARIAAEAVEAVTPDPPKSDAERLADLEAALGVIAASIVTA